MTSSPNCTDPRLPLYAIGRPNATEASEQTSGAPGAVATDADIVAHAVRVGKAFSGVSLAACGVALAVLISGCGGTEHDAHEPSGVYHMEVVRASFPAEQAISRDTRLMLVVRNSGTHTIPNVAISLNSLSYTSDYPHLAVDKRPVWIVNKAPGPVPTPRVLSEEVYPAGGSETAYVNTWALGKLAPGASKSFVWRVTPVKAGNYTVYYTVAAGLDGKARARLASGGPVVGKFVASVAPKPPPTHVDPQTGQVVAGANPASATQVGAVP